MAEWVDGKAKMVSTVEQIQCLTLELQQQSLDMAQALIHIPIALQPDDELLVDGLLEVTSSLLVVLEEEMEALRKAEESSEHGLGEEGKGRRV
ncbi:MAG: hypothetical protein Q9170_005123 [Blastenia crenularia]